MDDFLPSAFTPFARRFTDEKARDLRDTKELYARVRAMHLASRFANRAAANIELGGAIYGAVMDRLSEPLQHIFCQLIDRLLQGENTIFDFPTINLDVTHFSLKELVDLRHFLRAKEHFHAHEERVVSLLIDCLSRIVGNVADALPESLAPSPFTLPLIYLLPDPKLFVESLFGLLWQQSYVDNGLFVDVSRRMSVGRGSASSN